MTLGAESAFADLFADVPEADAELVVVNRTAPEQVTNLLDRAFADQSVAVEEATLPDEADDDVVLLRDGERVTASSLESVTNAFLLVNGTSTGRAPAASTATRRRRCSPASTTPSDRRRVVPTALLWELSGSGTSPDAPE